MATLRDDVVKAGRRVVEAVESRAGREIVPRQRMDVLESAESDNRVLRKTLEWIGFTLFNYQGSQPSPYRMPTDMLPQARIFTAGQALRTWMDDPMAGQQVDLYVSFVFGRGVPRPQAHDEDVQAKLDETWDDPANQRVLTSFERLVEKGVDAAIQSNVYFLVFDDGVDGRVRLSLKRFEDVIDAVRHPVDSYRILFYKASERQMTYDYTADAYVTPTGAAGQPQLVYHEALDAFDDDDPVMVAQDNAANIPRPPAGKLRPGKLLHFAVNKTSEMAFGVPRMRRLQRWFEAYNSILESHVNRMRAAASIYMKQTARGSQGDLDRLALMAQGASGRRSMFGGSEEAGDGGQHQHGAAGPVGPGILQQNESLQWDAFKIDSGAADVAASVPQLRAQISGPFSPAYYGQDPGAIAGQQAVELPTLKFIELEQEAWTGVFRKFARRAIDRAVETGDLTEYRDPTEEELQRIAAHQEQGTPLDGLEFDPQTGQIKRDLGFDISLPSPLKRAMADLVTSAVQTATAVDPMGQNPELSRWLFGFILAEAFDVNDPQRIVDQVLPRHALQQQQDETAASGGQPGGGRDAAAGEQGSVGADGKRHPADNPYGARVNAPNPEDRPVSEAPAAGRGPRRLALAALRDQEGVTDDEFSDVRRMAAAQLERLGNVPALAGSVNGNGTGPDA